MRSKIATIIAALTVLAGCSAPKLTQKPSLAQKDTIITHIRDSVVLRDSIVYYSVPKETESASVMDKISKVSTSLAESVAYVSDGKLHHSIRNITEKIIPIKVSIPEKVHTEDTYHGNNLIRTVKETVERDFTLWEKMCLVVGKWTIIVLGSLCAAGLLVIVIKIIKIFKK